MEGMETGKRGGRQKMEVCLVLPWALPRVNSAGTGRREHITRSHSAAPGWGPGA